MAAYATLSDAPAEFDPLIEFYLTWNTRLAERYLPLPDLPGRYQCVDGRLFITPAKEASLSYGAMSLANLITTTAVDFHIYGSVNLCFTPDRWIEPEVTVLHQLPQDDEKVWVPARLCTMVVEFVSPSSRWRDRVDKPRLCAEGGIPHFMRVEIIRSTGHVSVELRRLVDGAYGPLASAIAGQVFEVDEPFPVTFDPRQLLRDPPLSTGTPPIKIVDRQLGACHPTCRLFRSATERSGTPGTLPGAG